MKKHICRWPYDCACEALWHCSECPDFMRASYSGITPALQADNAGPIPAARSKFMKYKLNNQYVVTCEAADDDYAAMWSTMYDSVKEAKCAIKDRKGMGLPYYWDTVKIHRIRFKYRKTRWD